MGMQTHYIALCYLLVLVTSVYGQDGVVPPAPIDEDSVPVFDVSTQQGADPGMGAEVEYYKGVPLYDSPPALMAPERAMAPHRAVPAAPLVASRLRFDATGRSFAFAPDLLPPASDPNDIQFYPLTRSSSLSTAVEPVFFSTRARGVAADETTPLFQFGIQARPGIYYDTGAFEDGASQTVLNPAQIALDGSPAAHRRGQISFSKFDDFGEVGDLVPLRLQAGTQLLDMLGLGQGQAYIDAPLFGGEELQIRTLVFRLERQEQGWLAGKAETLFGDLGSSPVLLETGALPIGVVSATSELDEDTTTGDVFDGVSQLRYHRYLTDSIDASLSIEDQETILERKREVVGLGNDDTLLHRWPTFVARTRINGANGFDSCQVAGLVRRIGYDGPDYQDHFATAWGLSTIARMCDETADNAVSFGATGGRGIGGYLYGGTPSAVVLEDDRIESLWNFGAYAAYQHVWYRTDKKESISSNLAYGYIHGQAPTAADNHEIHQAWCNLLWNFSDSSAAGFEYQYGRREVESGVQGDNHRVMLVLAVSTATTATKAEQDRTQRSAFRAAAPAMPDEATFAPPARSMSARRF